MVKKYNIQKLDNGEEKYLLIEGRKNEFTKRYHVNIQPTEKKGNFTSIVMFTGTGLSIKPSRWSDKKLALYDSMLAKYADRLAEEFTQEQKRQQAQGRELFTLESSPLKDTMLELQGMLATI